MGFCVCEGITCLEYNTVSYGSIKKSALVIIGLIINKKILGMPIEQNNVQSESIAQNNYIQTDLSILHDHITFNFKWHHETQFRQTFSFFRCYSKVHLPAASTAVPPRGSDQVSSFHWRREGWFCCDIQAILSCHANPQGSISIHPPGGNFTS